MGHYNLIKLNATSSTNDKVKTLIKSGKIGSGDIVWAEYQYKGRGQYKNKWTSTRGKNLLISLYKEFKVLTVQQSSYINFVVSLSIIDTIDHYIPSNNYIKWPNDILSAQKKISGILIENNIKGDKFKVTGYPTIKLIKDTQVIEYNAKVDRTSLDLFLKEMVHAD